METDKDSSGMMDEVSEECLVKEVDVAVPKTDDTTLPVLTFRVWVLGIISCVLISFANQFMWYRANPMMVTSISAQLLVVPIGHLMARTITKRKFFQGTKFEFSLNPAPFNVKEHVLITIFANAGAGTVYATHILTGVKIFYKRKLTLLPAAIVMLTTQVLGYGWAGMMRKFLVDPAAMWWPANLVQVSLFRVLHEKEKRAKGGLSRTQFFMVVLTCAAAYCVLPSYLFTLLTSVSWVCWFNPKSVLVNQLGSGTRGLGLGSFALDWTTVSSYLGSPLASPWYATANIIAGYVLVMYVLAPVSYWLNIFKAKNFPIFSTSLFIENGQKYNVDSIVSATFKLDKNAYARSGPLYLTTFFAMTYGLGFATLSAAVVHVILFNGRDVWKQTKNALGGSKKMDIHTKMMKAYKEVPMWWFYVLLVVNVALTIWVCEYYKDMLQLPWWGVLLACAISLIFTLPVGIIQATTNQQIGLNVITEYIIGYLYPGRPVANMCFKVYGYISMFQAITFLQDFKLGHYMKIPPRLMFMAQTVGTIISVAVYTGTAWWMMADIPGLCDPSKLPPGSPWTCAVDTTFYDASVIWGLVGPRRIFGDLGHYAKVNWFFLGGALAPVLVWLAQKAFPKQRWIGYINMPVLLGATSMMPPATAVNYTSWIILAFLSGYVIYRYRPEWWQRYNYLVSAGLEAGTTLMTMLVFFCLQYANNTGLDWWGNRGEGCPVAACPTAKGLVVDGCPVF